MADYKVTDTELTSIANAIRTKGGTSAQLEFPTGFVSAVQAIPTGGGGDDIDYSYLPNSDTSKVAASSDYTMYSYDSGNHRIGRIYGNLHGNSASVYATNSQLSVDSNGVAITQNWRPVGSGSVVGGSVVETVVSSPAMMLPI